MSEGLGECEMLWEHQLTAECFHSFFEFSQTFTRVSIKQLDYELKIIFYCMILDEVTARVNYNA